MAKQTANARPSVLINKGVLLVRTMAEAWVEKYKEGSVERKVLAELVRRNFKMPFYDLKLFLVRGHDTRRAVSGEEQAKAEKALRTMLTRWERHTIHKLPFTCRVEEDEKTEIETVYLYAARDKKKSKRKKK